MLTFILYALAFVVIGIGTGLVARRHMPGGEQFGLMAHLLVAAVGAVVGGLAWLVLLGAGWLDDGRAEVGHGYSHLSTEHTLPGYWISLVIALATAMLLTAIFKLFVSRDTLT
jgi:uncharacterized membrane protein YeaQ/YmgE (transglycosylase-associated protein family)